MLLDETGVVCVQLAFEFWCRREKVMPEGSYPDLLALQTEQVSITCL